MQKKKLEPRCLRSQPTKVSKSIGFYSSALCQWYVLADIMDINPISVWQQGDTSGPNSNRCRITWGETFPDLENQRTTPHVVIYKYTVPVSFLKSDSAATPSYAIVSWAGNRYTPSRLDLEVFVFFFSNGEESSGV